MSVVRWHEAPEFLEPVEHHVNGGGRALFSSSRSAARLERRQICKRTILQIRVAAGKPRTLAPSEPTPLSFPSHRSGKARSRPATKPPLAVCPGPATRRQIPDKPECTGRPGLFYRENRQSTFHRGRLQRSQQSSTHIPSRSSLKRKAPTRQPPSVFSKPIWTTLSLCRSYCPSFSPGLSSNEAFASDRRGLQPWR